MVVRLYHKTAKVGTVYNVNQHTCSGTSLNDVCYKCPNLDCYILTIIINY